MEFENHWDSIFIEMLRLCDAGEKAVITGSLIEYTLISEPGSQYRRYGIEGYYI